MRHNPILKPQHPGLVASDQWRELLQMHARLRRWALDHALDLWANLGRDQQHGGFYEKLAQDGQPLDLPRRGRVTPRQIYCFAVAGELGWTGPWRAIVKAELDIYLTRFFRPDGLIRGLVAADATVLDDTPSLYDQAFGMFALAKVHQALNQRGDLEAKALTLLTALKTRQARAQGGFEETVPPSLPLQSNPHMHLFEAALAWAEISDAPVWQAQADEIAHLCLDKFIHAETGGVREFFDYNWNPVAGLEGHKLEPGHQFEWGWLLLRWGQMRGRSDAITAAKRMIGLAEAHGIDRARGVAINVILDDLSINDAQARLWPQTERIKASLLLAQFTGNPQDLNAAIDGATGLLKYLDVPVAGLWLDRMTTKGDFIPEAAPASSFYHILCALMELHSAIETAA